MTWRISAADLAGKREGRYDRQALMPWWEQARVSAARVLVIGAGALGNEVLKGLALTGIGRVLVYDMDRIERSNLSRAVLFRDGDVGRTKVEAACARAAELDPAVLLHGHAENAVHAAGLGVFAWADVVIGAVDNREARVFINGACARVGRAWVDGAIEGLDGVVRVFDPARGACYECTMSAVDRRLLAERRSCALLGREAAAAGHAPATAVAASIVGGFQVLEAIKLLHGQPGLAGQGLHVHGLASEASRIAYPRREDCPGHDALPPLEALGVGVGDVTLGELLARAERELGAGACLELSRDVVVALTCEACGTRDRVGRPLGAVGEREARCPGCGEPRVVELAGTVGRDALGGVDLGLTPRDLGVPPFDVLVARAGLGPARAWRFDGDAAAVLGPLWDVSR